MQPQELITEQVEFLIITLPCYRANFIGAAISDSERSITVREFSTKMNKRLRNERTGSYRFDASLLKDKKIKQFVFTEIDLMPGTSIDYAKLKIPLCSR